MYLAIIFFSNLVSWFITRRAEKRPDSSYYITLEAGEDFPIGSLVQLGADGKAYHHTSKLILPRDRDE